MMKKVLHNQYAASNKKKSVSKKISPPVKQHSAERFEPLPTPKVYYIKWRDAFTETDEWHDTDSMTSQDYTCETIGFIIEENNKSNYYSIAGSFTIEGMFTSVINIPKEMVITKKLIKLS